MNSNTHDYDQSAQIISKTIHPHEQSIQHRRHVPQYRCSHINRIDEKSPQISNFQPNSVVDYPYVLLNDQHIRDLTDVYRREKDFLKQRNKYSSHNEIFTCTEENLEKDKCESQSKYYVKEYCYNIPCNCEISLPGRIFQGCINGIKMSIEFFLFMGYTIKRRNELLECHYPFDRYHSDDCQVNYNYPFVQRPTYSHEMKQLNAIRNQVNKKRSPMKHTTTRTYYDIH